MRHVDKASRFDDLARSYIGIVQRHRGRWLSVAAIVFVAGCAISLRQLRFDLSDIHLLPAAVILLVMAPATQTYGAVNLLLLSRCSGGSLSFRQAFRANNAAQLAEILPLPAGAIVRIGALVAAGAPAGKSATLVTLGALLWVSVAAAGAGLALLQQTGDQRFLAVFFVCFAAVAIIAIQLARLAGWVMALILVAHRAFGCVLMAIRLTLAFMAIGLPLVVLTALVFGLANIAGSAASIAPAGLGLSELFGAAIAAGIGIDPFAAFLAIAVNRLLGLAMNGGLFAATEIGASLAKPGRG